MQYRRKYNSKYKHETRLWKPFYVNINTLTSIDWILYEFRLNNVIYSSPSIAFIEEYNKLVMWEKLKI